LLKITRFRKGEKLMQIENAFNDGIETALNALKELGAIYDHKDNAEMPSVFGLNAVCRACRYAGFLTTIMHSMLAQAPSEEAVDEIISWARKGVKKDWLEEQRKGASE